MIGVQFGLREDTSAKECEDFKCFAILISKTCNLGQVMFSEKLEVSEKIRKIRGQCNLE